MALTDGKHLLKTIKRTMGLEKTGFIYMRFSPLHSVTHVTRNDW